MATITKRPDQAPALSVLEGGAPAPSQLHDLPVAPAHGAPLQRAARALVARARNRAANAATEAELAALRAGVRRAHGEYVVLGAVARQAEQARRCSQAFITSLIAVLDTPCVQVDRDGYVTAWNPSMSTASGVSAEHAMGRPIAQILTPPAYARLASQVATAFGGSPGRRYPTPPIVLDEPLEITPALHARRVTLAPMYRIPSVIESVLVLITLA